MDVHPRPRRIALARAAGPLLAIALLLCVAVTAAHADGDAADTVPATQPAKQVRPLTYDALKKSDRILFLGDDHTQQMFHTRGVAAGLLALRPEYDLRFFTGGMNKATAKDAIEWVDDLLDLTKPTAVIIWFGMNDMTQDGNIEAGVKSYQNDLGKLIDHVAAYESVRMISVMSPIVSIIAGGDTAMAETLRKIEAATKDAADERELGFIATRSHFEKIISGEIQGSTAALSIDGRHLTEEAHVIVASVVLRDIGAPEDKLDKLGWSPLLPREMVGVRDVLALDLDVPEYPKAQHSHDLYESIRRFDEKFFVMWRLSGKAHSAPSRETLAPQVSQAWVQVRQIAGEYRKN